MAGIFALESEGKVEAVAIQTRLHTSQQKYLKVEIMSID
jgi:hypothetical protein